MTSTHWRSILYAILTFLVGGSNQLFGTHFQVAVVYGVFFLCVTLIALEAHLFRTKNWSQAEKSIESYIPQLVPLIQKLIDEGKITASSSTPIATVIPPVEKTTTG